MSFIEIHLGRSAACFFALNKCNNVCKPLAKSHLNNKNISIKNDASPGGSFELGVNSVLNNQINIEVDVAPQPNGME